MKHLTTTHDMNSLTLYSGLLELSLDLNSTSAIPPELRFDVSLPHIEPLGPSVVPKDISPEQANELLLEYTTAVRNGQIPPLDLHVIRQQIDDRLAVQDTLPLKDLEARVHQPDILRVDSDINLPSSELPGYMTIDHETDCLLRLDAKASGDQPFNMTPKEKEAAEKALANEEKHWADLTPREVERQAELQNPQSQHNWLKLHAKVNPAPAGEGDDMESDTPIAPRKRNRAPAKAVGGLAKQAMERARLEEGMSPGAVSNMDEDDPMFYEDGGARRKGRDPDSTYRLKGGRSGGGGGGGNKNKRKRSDVDIGAGAGVGGAFGGKKPRVEETVAGGAGSPGDAAAG